MPSIKTDIVETHRTKHNKFFTFGFAVLYMAATIYIFLIQDEYSNEYLSVASFIVYLIGGVILFRISFIKPKTLGTIQFKNDALEIVYKDDKHKLDLSGISQITLNFSDYAKWSQNIWGSNNFLKIETADGDSFNFEILIKSEQHKNDLKQLFKSPTLKDKFTLKYVNQFNLSSF